MNLASLILRLLLILVCLELAYRYGRRAWHQRAVMSGGITVLSASQVYNYFFAVAATLHAYQPVNAPIGLAGALAGNGILLGTILFTEGGYSWKWIPAELGIRCLAYGIGMGVVLYLGGWRPDA